MARPLHFARRPADVSLRQRGRILTITRARVLVCKSATVSVQCAEQYEDAFARAQV